MGMFDYVTWNGDVYQTKDTPSQFMDHYYIEDGQLYEEQYDVVDRSDPNATGLRRFVGMITRENVRKVKFGFTGTIVFYRYNEETHEWMDFEAKFLNGYLANKIRRIKE